MRVPTKQSRSSWLVFFTVRSFLAQASTLVVLSLGKAIDFLKVSQSIPGPRGTHVKVVEKPGPTIMRGISSTNPFKLEVCPKDDCPINEGGLNCLGKCSCENIIYRATCIKCVEEQVDNGVQEDQVIKHQYIGETSRTVRTRRIQHLNDYKKCIKYKQTHGQTVTDNLGENDKLSSFILDHKTNIQRRLTLIQRRI